MRHVAAFKELADRHWESHTSVIQVASRRHDMDIRSASLALCAENSQ